MAKRKQSSGERTFLHWWGVLSGCPPPPESEYLFAKSIKRRWRFDFAWPEPGVMVAVEIDGATWAHGRHVRGKGFQNDAEKLNAAVVLGWKVLRFTPKMLDDDPVKIIGQVVELLEMGKK